MSNESNNKNFEEQEILKQSIMFKVFTKEARERLNRVRLTHPEIAEQALAVIMQSYKGEGLVSDEELRYILSMLTSQKKGFRIKK